jgi:hypothetical protein
METITTKISGADINMSVPITKIDEEKRLVSGFATLDNIDKHNDVVDADASRKAFDRFRGNIREMHMPKAVGRMVEFETKTHYDEKTQKSYEGIYVTARVSKGAQDTWEKVLDGTLSAFSIGGIVREKATQKDAEGNGFSVIKDYDLVELSLVDNPANQLANVFSIQKVNGSLTVTGFATEDDAEESNEHEDTVMNKFFTAFEKFIEQKIGGNNKMAKINEEEVAVVVEEAEVAETASEEVVEKAAEVEVETTEELNIEAIVEAAVKKALERLSESVDNHDEVEVVAEVTPEPVVEKGIDSPTVDAMKELTDGLTAIAEKFADFSGTIDTRIAGLEKSFAFKKSADIAGPDAEDETNFWGGTFSVGTDSAE